MLSAITQRLEIGDYSEWSEAQRVGWLQSELSSPRPLIPWEGPFDAKDQEVLATFRTIAATPTQALGVGQALQIALADGKLESLKDMVREWPFFRTRLSMLEMVFAKSDHTLSAHYDQLLVEPALVPVGQRLRDQLQQDIATLLTILDSEELRAHDPWGQQSIGLRNIYTAPLNLLQAELIRRQRAESKPDIQQAQMVTMAGIAAGMRNTG